MWLWLLYLLLPLAGVWLIWPVVARVDPYVGDTFWRVRLAYRKLDVKSPVQKIRLLTNEYLEATIPKNWLAPLERILTLAGRPAGLHATDIILMQIGIVVGMSFLDMWAKKSSPVVLMLLTVAVVTMPWRRWLGQIQARRLSASEQIRSLKRRYVSLLRQGTPFEESLKIISHEAQGDFGVVFRRRLKEGRMRGLSEALTDFQREFKVTELTRFIQAIRVADRSSMAALADIIEKQVREETAKLDAFIEKRKAVTINRMRMFTMLAFIYMVVFAGYFVYQILAVYFATHSIFGL